MHIPHNLPQSHRKRQSSVLRRVRSIQTYRIIHRNRSETDNLRHSVGLVRCKHTSQFTAIAPKKTSLGTSSGSFGANIPHNSPQPLRKRPVSALHRVRSVQTYRTIHRNYTATDNLRYSTGLVRCKHTAQFTAIAPKKTSLGTPSGSFGANIPHNSPQLHRNRQLAALCRACSV